MRVRMWVAMIVLVAGAACAAPVPRERGLVRFRALMPKDLWDYRHVDWVNDVAVIAMPRLPNTDAARSKLLEDFQLDMLDWYCGLRVNTGKFFRDRGIRCSGPEEYEYQEALQFTHAQAAELFTGNGLAIKLNGQPAKFSPTQYGGKPFMCHNAPKWQEVVKQGLTRLAPFGDSVTQDNIGVPLNKGNGNFCDWCSRKFARYLTRNFSAQDRAALGVGDLSKLDLRAYINRKRQSLKGDDLIADPLIKEFIRFQYRAQIEAWIDCATATKREALKRGVKIPALYGNQWGAWGVLPYATVLSQYVDVVWIEGGCTQPCFVDPVQAWAPLFYKIGRAAGDFHKPVWTIEYPEHKYPDKKMPTGAVLCDAFANGGFVVGLWSLTDMDSPRYAINKELCDFVAAHRPLFTRRDQFADLALVYSVPTQFWRGFSSLRTGQIGLNYYIHGIARIMEEAHLPYDALLLGHPDLFDDTVQLERMKRRRAIILPAVDCLSDRQAQALREYVKQGGQLVIIPPFGLRDEEFNRRPKPVFADLLPRNFTQPVKYGKGRFIPIPKAIMDDWFGGDKRRSKGFEAAREILLEALGREPSVEVQAPKLTWATAWRCGEDRIIAVHLVNYDLDFDRDVPRPARNVRLRVRLPQSCPATRAILLAPGRGAETLPMNTVAGAVEVTVPQVDLMATVAFSPGRALEAADEMALVRRTIDRIGVATESAPPPDLVKMYEDVRSLYRRGDYENAESAAQKLGVEASRVLGKTIQANLAARRQVREAALHLPAKYRFDFGDGPVAEGWTGVKSSAVWDKGAAFGFDEGASIRAGAGAEPDALHGDDLFSPEPARFHARVDNGRYEVSVITGSPSTYHKCAVTCVDAEGATRLLGTLSWGGLWVTRSFPVRVTDGVLDLRFYCGPVGPTFSNGRSWAVTGIALRELTDTPSADAQRAQDLERASLRDWLVLGPFDDRACEGMTMDYGPEASLSLTHSYPGKEGQVAWQRYTAQPEGLAPVPLHMLLDDHDQTVAYAVTHVKAPKARPARLWVTTTGRGVAWWNGQEVVRDETTHGLLVDEDVVPVKLAPGWNRLLLKVCNNWGDLWGFNVCLTDAAGRPLEGLQCSARGAEAAQFPVALPLERPTLYWEKDHVDLGDSLSGTVLFRNTTAQPLTGAISVQPLVEPEDAVTITGPEPGRFTELQPGKTFSATFELRSTKPVPSESVKVDAEVRVGNRRRRSSATVKVRQPELSLRTYRRGEPEQTLLDPCDDLHGWRVGQSADQAQMSIVQGQAKQGTGALRADVVNNGDGREAYVHLLRTISDNKDWTGYNTLRLWAHVTDANPDHKTRALALQIRDADGGLLDHHYDVPVNKWTELDLDLTFWPRAQVNALALYLYETHLKQQNQFTWRFDDIRLLHASQSKPERSRFGPGAARGRRIAVRAVLLNRLARGLKGTCAVEPPPGWKVEPGPTVPAEAVAGRVWTHDFLLTPPAKSQGRKYDVAARFVGEGMTLQTMAGVQVHQLVTIPRAGAAPKIDGKLDDPCWRQAAKIGHFVLNTTGRPVQAPTEVLLTYDDQWLYLGYTCHEPHMKQLLDKVTRRDAEVWMDDCVEFYVDADADRAAGDYDHYVINARGVLRDERGGRGAWNSRCRAAASRAADRWFVEAAIAFADYGGAPKPGAVWAGNFHRTRPAKPGGDTEYQCWSCTYGAFDSPAAFGDWAFGE